MTEIQNPKQKKTIALAAQAPALRVEPVLNLWFVICDLFVIWCLEFVILDTKLHGRAIYLWLQLCGTGMAHWKSRFAGEDQVFQDQING